MRILEPEDLADISELSQRRLLVAIETAKIGYDIQLMSDYSGNIWYTDGGKVSKPLNVCVPKLKNEPKFGGE